MKYNININQVGVYRAGLLRKTDFVDWALIEFIKDLFAHPRTKKLPFEGKLFVWINYNHILEEMPMLEITTKNPLTDRFKKLKKLLLIETVALKDNTVYARLTEYCMDISSYRESDKITASPDPPITPNSDRVSLRTPTGGITPNSDSTSSISNQVVNHSSSPEIKSLSGSQEGVLLKDFTNCAQNQNLQNQDQNPLNPPSSPKPPLSPKTAFRPIQGGAPTTVEILDQNKQTNIEYKTKFKDSASVHDIERYWQAVLSEAGYSSILPFTKRECGHIKQLVTWLAKSGNRLTIQEIISYVIPEWQVLSQGRLKGRLKGRPSFVDLFIYRHDVLDLMEKISKAPKEITTIYTRIEDLPKTLNHVDYELYCRFIKKFGSVTLTGEG